MIGPAEAFSVELVDSFRSGGTYGEPAVLSDDLAAADGRVVAGRLGEDLRHGLAAELLQIHFLGGEALQRGARHVIHRRIDALVNGVAQLFRDFLIEFAKKIGKPDPEVYVDTGKWKARQGGNGLPAANDVKIKFTNCTSEEHAKIYKLVRQFDDELVNLFTPFGRVAPELGQKLLHEVLIVDIRTNVPILSIQPFGNSEFDYAVKVRTMNVASHDDLQRMVSYQIKKFNACRKCLKCESLCKAGAISIIGDEYYINPDKCVHCKMCVTPKYLDGGCMMEKYLRTLSKK